MTEWEAAVAKAAERIVFACEPGYARENESKEDRDWIMAQYEKLAIRILVWNR